MEQKEQRKHIWYFDYLRVFAMLCVIFMHVGAGAMRELNGLNWHVCLLLLLPYHYFL